MKSMPWTHQHKLRIFLAHSPVWTIQHEIRLGAVTNHLYTEGTTSNFRSRTGCPHTMFRKAFRHELQENRPWPFPSFYILHQTLKSRKIRRCVHPNGTAPTYRICHNVPLFQQIVLKLCKKQLICKQQTHQVLGTVIMQDVGSQRPLGVSIFQRPHTGEYTQDDGATTGI